MTTFSLTAVSNAALAFKKGLTIQILRALRDNVLSAFEGDPTAVAAGATLRLAALERLQPGSTIRLRNDGIVSLGASSAVIIAYSFAFLQIGTVRITYSHQFTGTGASISINRLRAGSVTLLSTTGLNGTTTFDTDVLPGDKLDWVINTTPSFTTAQISNCRISTNGQNLWPGIAYSLENTF
jgi:hypothetical protein